MPTASSVGFLLLRNDSRSLSMIADNLRFTEVKGTPRILPSRC